MNLTRYLTWPVILTLALLAELAFVVPAYRQSPQGFLYGDSHFYACVTESLTRDGDLDILNQCFPDATTVAEVLPKLEGEPAGDYGWAKGEYLTIKQSPLLGIVAIPFYLVFGELGFLLFNLLVLNLLVVGTAKLAGDGPCARVLALVMLLTTPLIRFAFNFSPDLFLSLLMLGALLAAKCGRPGLAGLCAGVAVSTKLYVLVLLLPVPVLVWLVATRRFRALAFCILGGVLGLAPGLALNTVQFGAPWVTGYERQLKVEQGVISLADHSSRFTDPFLEGLQDLLFNPKVGIVADAPLWCLWPLAMLAVPRKIVPWACAATIILTFALFAPYNGRDSGSTTGNRYLFPALVAGFAILGVAADCLASARFAASRKVAESGDTASAG